MRNENFLKNLQRFQKNSYSLMLIQKNYFTAKFFKILRFFNFWIQFFEKQIKIETNFFECKFFKSKCEILVFYTFENFNFKELST